MLKAVVACLTNLTIKKRNRNYLHRLSSKEQISQYWVQYCPNKSFSFFFLVDKGIQGVALYPIYCLINHSCYSNTNYVKFPDLHLELRSQIPIKKGEQIYTRYISATIGNYTITYLLSFYPWYVIGISKYFTILYRTIRAITCFSYVLMIWLDR